MKAWVTLIEGACFFFSTEKEALDFILESVEEGINSDLIDPPELLEANTDEEFRGMLSFVCNGLQ